MFELSKKLKERSLEKMSLPSLKTFFKENKSLYNEFKSYWSILDPNHSRNTKQKVIDTIAAFPSKENIKNHIEQYLIDSQGEVSPSKISLLNKINPNFNNIIIEHTKTFPIDFKIVGRCELIRKDITEFPKCKNCNNPVSWANSSKLLNFCSKECSDNSDFIKNKKSDTILKLYGVKSYTESNEFKLKSKNTKKERYGNESFTNREKAKETWVNLYGVDNPLKDKDIRKKAKKTMKLKYGVENYVEHNDFRAKSEKSCLKKFGFRNQTQNPKIYEKILKSLHRVKKYKDTNILYQSSYELFFLELMEERGLLKEIKKPKRFTYEFNNETCIYNPDFLFKGTTIEIKSTWTYNRNGADKTLEAKNHAKWDSVKSVGENIVILMNKKEIKNFVKTLN